MKTGMKTGKYSVLRLTDRWTDGQINYKFRVFTAKKNTFRIEDEDQGYRLHISGYSGTAGNSLGGHDGMKFSTLDRDNDKNSGNCALGYKGGWWWNK